MSIAGHVIGMFILGSVALSAVGRLYNTRVLTPLPDYPQAAAPDAPRGSAVGRTLAGVRTNLALAAFALNHDRAVAMGALDAARRAARTLSEALPTPATTALVTTVEHARRLVQNGRPDDATRALRDAAARVPQQVEGDPLGPAALTPFDDAVLITPRGELVGSLELVEGQLLVRDGALPGLGLVPTSAGDLRRLNTAGALFGQPHRLGTTLVIEGD